MTSLFESISYHNDSADKLNECKYQSAYSLFNSGSYAEAKNIFNEIASYSNSSEMVNECDYVVAMNYKNNGEYVKAMKAFNDLGTYRDCSSQFTKTENALVSSNRRNSFFVNERSAFGTWEDDYGNYVKYVDKGNGSSHTCYSLASSDGTYYKLEYGIHYKGDDYNWKKQWIYQKVDNNTVQVYNYIDGQIYNLSKN